MNDDLIEAILAMSAAGQIAYEIACRRGDATLAAELLKNGREVSRLLSAALKRRAA